MGVCVHGSNSCRIALRIEALGTPPRRLIATIKSCASAPATAAYKLAIRLHHEVCAVLDELSIDAHYRPAGCYLLFVEKGLLQLTYGEIDQLAQSVYVRRVCKPVLQFRICHVSTLQAVQTTVMSRETRW